MFRPTSGDLLPMAKESILLVDDVPVNLKLTDMLLRREGFKVHTAADAEQALALLRSFRPDLILVDIELPGMDGLSLTRRVKMNPSTRDIVVLALSGRAGADRDEEARAAGCDGYITRPVDSATLISNIRQHLDRHLHAPDEASPEVAGHPIPAGDGPADEPDLESLKRSFLEGGALQ